MTLMDKSDRPGHFTDWSAFQNQAGDVLGDEFWQDIAGLIPNTGPRIDMYYTESKVVVLAEIPELQSPEQIRVMLEEGKLVMEGEIPRLYPVTDNRLVQKERFFGAFRRSLTLPKQVAENGIRAKYDRGLLTVELPIDPFVKQTQIGVDFSSQSSDIPPTHIDE